MQVNTRAVTADNSRRRLWQRVVSTLVCVVVFCTTYALIMPAITISEPVYCNLDEHTHTDDCYADGELVCTRLEHMHNLSCYSDPTADTETEDDWIAAVADANVSGNSVTDVMYIAVSQLGYAESTNNYIVHEDGASVSGYTRFGDWSGDAYAPWNIAFVNFCVYYAGYDYLDGYQPVDDLIEWVTVLSQEDILYTPYALPELGQLAIVNEEGTLYLGIVSGRGDNGEVRVIVGDYNGKVTKLEFTPDETNLLGYVGLENILNIETSLDFVDEPVSDGLTASIVVNGDDVNSDNAASDSNSDTVINNEDEDHDNEEPVNGDDGQADADETPDATVSDDEEINDEEAENSSPSDDENSAQENTDVSVDGTDSVNGETPEENSDNDKPADEATPVDPDAEESNDEETPIDGQYNADGDVPATADEPADADDNGSTDGGTTTTSVDMTLHITSVSVTHKGQGTNWEWKDINEGNVYSGDSFSFKINYKLPVRTLGNGVNSITYQLPKEIKLFDKKDGIVKNSAGDIVGSYEITIDGLITIIFNDDYVQKNANSSDDGEGIIDGDISAEISFDQSSWGEDGKIDIKFTDEYRITIENSDASSNDLKIEKKAELDQDTGEVTYTVTVSSVNGTGQPVKVTDSMTNAKYTGETITVTKKGGTPVDDQSIADGSTYFELTLPKMDAGDVYTITYKGSVIDGSKQAKNSVTATSQKDNGTNLYVRDDATVEYEEGTNPLKKEHTVNADGTVTWTITVGTQDMNLSGWTLSDTINGVPLPESTQVAMKDSTGILIEGANKLPYTFTGDVKGPVTVTYTTDLTYLPSANTMTNTATLTNDDGKKSFSDTAQTTDDNRYDYFRPVSKEAGSVNKTDKTDSQGKTLANIDWTYTIDATTFSIKPTLKDADSKYYWSFQDSMSNQYFTSEQRSALEASIKQAMSNANIDEGDYRIEWQYGWFNNQQIENGFTVKVYKALEKDLKIEFKFTATGPLNDVKKSQPFYNAGYVNGDQNAYVEAKYYPVAHKENATDGTKDTLAYMDLKEKVLKWKFNVAPPEGCTELTITENLPTGLDFDSLNLSLQLDQWEYLNQQVQLGKQYFFYRTDNWGGAMYDAKQESISELYLGSLTISTLDNNNTFTITPDGDLIKYLLDKGYDIRFEIGLELPKNLFSKYERNDDAESTLEKKEYTNSITVKYKTSDSESDEKTDTDSATQIITNEDTRSYITKQSKQIDDSSRDSDNAYIEYTLDINPQAEDIVSGKDDQITVVDTLSFSEKSRVAISLASVKVYDAATGQELPLSEYSYTHEPPTYSPQWNGGPYQHTSVITFKLPDAKHLKIVYEYAFVATDQNATLNIYNTAKITEGGTYGQTQNSVQDDVKIPEATANISAKLNIVKVDANDHSKVLAGARFELYKWHKPDNEDGHWDYVETVATENGAFQFTSLDKNVAYMLVEVTAPKENSTQYILDQTRQYFLIRRGNDPVVKPENFSSSYYIGTDQTLYIPNSRLVSTSATVVKKWQDENGKETSAPDGSSVTVKLKQTRTIYPPTLDLTTLGASASVNLTFGVNSQYTNQYNQSFNASVGDKIVVTVKVKEGVMGRGVENAHNSGTDTDTQSETTRTDTTSYIPGIMEVTDTANNHLICEGGTQEGNYRVFTYEYLVTGNATLTGWTYVSDGIALTNGALNSENISIEYTIQKHGTFDATTTEYYKANGEQTLDSKNNWTYTWTDLPVYQLDDTTGKILAYYSYSIEETEVSGVDMSDYTQEYSTDENGNLVVTNKKIDKSQIKIEKKWYDENDKVIDDTSAMSEVTVNLYQAIEGKTSNFIASGQPSTGGDSESGGDTGGDSGGDTGKTLTIKFKVGNNEKTFTETTNVSVTGSSVVLNVYSPWIDKGDPTVSVGEQTYRYTSTVEIGKYVENDDQYSTHTMTKYVFKIPLTADNTEIIIVASGGDLQKTFYKDPGASQWPDWFFAYEASAVSVQSFDDEIEIPSDEDDTTTPDTYPKIVNTYTLSSSNNWQYTVTNLPKTGTVDGKTVKFVYFIEETPVDGYSTWYSTDQNQWYISCEQSTTSSGTLYVKNKEQGDNKEITTSISVEKKWDDAYTAKEDVTVELWQVFTPVKQETFSYQAYLVYFGVDGEGWWPQVQYYDGSTNNPADDQNRMVKTQFSDEDLTAAGSVNFTLQWNYAQEKNQYGFNNADVKGFRQIRAVIPGAYTQFSDYAVSAVAVTLDSGESKYMNPDELAKVSFSPQYVNSGNKDSAGKEIWVPNYDNLEINLDEAMKTFYGRICSENNQGEYDQNSTVMFNDTFRIDITLSPVEKKVDNTGKSHTDEGADVYDKIKLDETGVRIDFKATAQQSSAAQGAIWMLYSTVSSDESAYADSKYHIWEQNANGSGDGIDTGNKQFYSGAYSTTTDSSTLSSAGIGYECVKENENLFGSALAAGANGTIEAYLKTIGGKNYAIVQMEIAGVTSIMTLPLEQLSTDNIYLALTCDFATLTDISVQSRATSFPTPSDNVTLKDAAILNDAGGWTHTWTGLPLTMKDKDTDTVTGYYTYFVKEVKVGDATLDESVGVDKIGKYSVEYSTYTPISNGNITITNHDTSVVLPESGGNGTHLYTLCGLALVFGAALTWIYLKRRKGVDAN